MKDVKNLIRPNIASLQPYPPGKPIEEVKRELGLKEVIKLASNENALGPSPKALEAIKKSLEEMNLYPDGNAFYLKRKLAQHWEIAEDEILVGNGSDEIIRMIVETFLNPGEEIIMGSPAFIIYYIAATVMDGKVIEVPLKDYTHDLEAMLKAQTPKTKIIFIANPNNPTGTMVDAQAVDSFMREVSEDVIVVFDEAYYEYTPDDFPETLNYVREGRNVLVLRTFSKIYGLAGLRVGYAMGKKEIFREMNRIRQPFNVNRVAQIAAMAALDDKEHVEESCRMNGAGKKFLYQELGALGIEYVPTAANFILINMKQSGREIYQKLLNKGIIVRPMDGYSLPDFIRVTIGKPRENEKFIAALREVVNSR